MRKEKSPFESSLKLKMTSVQSTQCEKGKNLRLSINIPDKTAPTKMFKRGESGLSSYYFSAYDQTTVSPNSCLTSFYLIMECSPRTWGVLSTILNELGRGWP